MHLKKIKVVALATTLFYLGTCNLTVKAYVIPEEMKEISEITVDGRTHAWVGQPLAIEDTEINYNVMKIETDDKVFENNAAGAGNFMPSLDEIVILDENVLLQEEVAKESDNLRTEITLRANLTDSELDLMYNIVAAEAKGESYEGKIAVAEVIFNRMDSKKFPNNITDIIYAPNQFQPVSNGSIHYAYSNLNVSLQEEIRNAVQDALEGSNYTEGALFFKTKNYHVNRTPVKQIGNHYFSK